MAPELLLPLLVLLGGLPAQAQPQAQAAVRVQWGGHLRTGAFAAGRLAKALGKHGVFVRVNDDDASPRPESHRAAPALETDGPRITLLADPAAASAAMRRAGLAWAGGGGGGSAAGSAPPEEGFALLCGASDAIAVAAGDPTGALYGALELLERITRLHVRRAAATPAATSSGAAALLAQVCAEADGFQSAPRFGYRALKINLPWSPYRAGLVRRTAVAAPPSPRPAHPRHPRPTCDDTVPTRERASPAACVRADCTHG